MKRFLTLIIIIISFTSCSQRMHDNKGKLSLTLKYDNSFSDREQLKTVIENRLTDYGINIYNFKFIENSKIQVDLPKTIDTLEVIKLLCTPGEFLIKETFNNTEIFEYLENLNKYLHDKGITSNDTSEYIKEYPLFSLLIPSIDTNGYLINGPVIGYSYEKDTAIVNKYLSDNAGNLPKDLELLWAKKKYNDFVLLIAIKNTNYLTAPITGEMIKYAKPETDHNNNNMIAIQVIKQYEKTWADLTRLNIGKSLAMIIDNIVYSCPLVNAEIPNGALSISGDLKLNETELISSLLDNGKLPCEIELIKINLEMK